MQPVDYLVSILLMLNFLILTIELWLGKTMSLSLGKHIAVYKDKTSTCLPLSLHQNDKTGMVKC
jgi:hypothetical protein